MEDISQYKIYSPKYRPQKEKSLQSSTHKRNTKSKFIITQYIQNPSIDQDGKQNFSYKSPHRLEKKQ